MGISSDSNCLRSKDMSKEPYSKMISGLFAFGAQNTKRCSKDGLAVSVLLVLSPLNENLRSVSECEQGFFERATK